MSLSSQTIPLWAWYHQGAASGHEITSSQRGATQGKGWQRVESIHGLYFMRWSQRDCRRWCADPPLGRALQKPQQFGKKVREERTCSDPSQATGLDGLHATVSPKKYSVKSWSVTRKGHSGAAHLAPKAAVPEKQVWLQFNVPSSPGTEGHKAFDLQVTGSKPRQILWMIKSDSHLCL